MGPQLVADKSFLQSLKECEVWCLARHYWVVYTPTLFIEILADLKKFTEDRKASEDEVLKLANKITPGETTFTCHHRILAVSDLLGARVEPDGRPIVHPDTVKTDRRGAALINEEPERIALRRWQARQFSDAEQVMAERWRESSRALDLEAFQKQSKNLKKIKGVGGLPEAINQMVDTPEFQHNNLGFLLHELGVDEATRNAVFERWLAASMPLLRDHLSYAYHCLRVYMGFYLALGSHLIGARNTHRIDLEYFLYLPFCKVFTSSDKFHRRLFDVFKPDFVRFVWGPDLKRDVASINAFYDGMSDDERKAYREKCGGYPPDLEGSFTLEVWNELMGSRQQHKPIKRDPKEKKKLVERLMKDYERLKREAQ